MDPRLPADLVRNQLSAALIAMVEHQGSRLGIGHAMLDQAAGAGGLSPVRPEGVNRQRRLARILEETAGLGESRWRATVESLVGQMRDGRWFKAVTAHPTGPTLAEIANGREAYVEPAGPGTRLAKVEALRAALSPAGWRLDHDGSLFRASAPSTHVGDRQRARTHMNDLERDVREGRPDQILASSRAALESCVKYVLEERGPGSANPEKFGPALTEALKALGVHPSQVEGDGEWQAPMRDALQAMAKAASSIALLRNKASSAHGQTKDPEVPEAMARLVGWFSAGYGSAMLAELDSA